MSEHTPPAPRPPPTATRSAISSARSCARTWPAESTRRSRPASRRSRTATCIGHAKSICLNFGIAGEFSGVCNLRFDDTNPAKEDPEYVAAIQDDVRWLGFEWNELRHASDYFQAYYLAAEKLIEQGKAYVCDLSAEEVRAYRGTHRAGPPVAVARPQRRGEPRPVPPHARR